MNKFIAFSCVACCAMLLLAGCPKLGSTPSAPPSKPGGTACGSRGMAPCPEGQYCDFAPEAQCGMADAPGTCKPRPEACPKIHKVVCGCNGNTYVNDCFAAQAGVSVKKEGACSAVQMCGGIANIQCPEGMKCADDPNDSCNPAQGGADCSGICQPE